MQVKRHFAPSALLLLREIWGDHMERREIYKFKIFLDSGDLREKTLWTINAWLTSITTRMSRIEFFHLLLNSADHFGHFGAN